MDYIKYANDNKEKFLEDLKELLKIDTVLIEQPEVKEKRTRAKKGAKAEKAEAPAEDKE